MSGMRSSIACVGGYGMLGMTALATEQYYIFSPAREIKSIDVRRKLFETAGELDGLINNAGSIETRHRIHESDPEEWWGVLEAKTKGTYLPTRDFLRRNLGRPLTILNTSSILSANTIPGYSQQDGVRTFAYRPGVVGTDIVTAMLEPVRALFDDTPNLASHTTRKNGIPQGKIR
ncbi:hypothetical protein M422DRAFT_263273 [Sphaerobolus stellatus SS14]|uniref:Uncharacterized protein n=1 Tax=Sphaerobolus stellatus (strain SS14) TaxID=990650 RepID=A0A0C9UIL3_SPHS4|nr:hypothetical protein M422DRAFT_263273 [Sphaerobolus stellatus SS14]